jgi:hypothetical protein
MARKEAKIKIKKLPPDGHRVAALKSRSFKSLFVRIHTSVPEFAQDEQQIGHTDLAISIDISLAARWRRRNIEGARSIIHRGSWREICRRGIGAAQAAILAQARISA